MDRIYLKQIEEDFEGININELKREAEQIILDCYNSIEKKNTEKLKGKIKSFAEKKINEYKNKNITFTNFKIHNTVISNYKKTASTATIYFSSSYEYYEETEKEKIKKQDRAKVEFIYVIDETKLDKKENLIGLHCPNCGSPITSLKNKRCNYCNTEVKEIIKRVFICNDIYTY